MSWIIEAKGKDAAVKVGYLVEHEGRIMVSNVLTDDVLQFEKYHKAVQYAKKNKLKEYQVIAYAEAQSKQNESVNNMAWVVYCGTTEGQRLFVHAEFDENGEVTDYFSRPGIDGAIVWISEDRANEFIAALPKNMQPVFKAVRLAEEK